MAVGGSDEEPAVSHGGRRVDEGSGPDLAAVGSGQRERPVAAADVHAVPDDGWRRPEVV